MHVSMGIFRLFMQGKLNAYLLWPLGKSVIINKHRFYVYSEHKRILLRTQIQYILHQNRNTAFYVSFCNIGISTIVCILYHITMAARDGPMAWLCAHSA